MIDIALLRAEPELVRENIRKKFQEQKLPLVDEALALDGKRRALQQEGDALRAERNCARKRPRKPKPPSKRSTPTRAVFRRSKRRRRRLPIGSKR